MVRVQGLELEIPQGALSETTLIRIQPVTGLSALEGWTLVSAFELSPDGLVFDVPATARASYTRGAGDPRLFTSKRGKEWSALTDSRYDAEAGIVTGSLLHFSYLSLQVAADGGSAGAGGASGAEAGATSGGVPTMDGGGGVAGLGQAGLAGDGGRYEGALGGHGSDDGGAGATGVGGESGGGGEGATGPVTCKSASGSGPSACMGGELSCVYGGFALSTETNWASCSDGHTYTIRCSGSGNTCSCSCLVDSVAQGSCSYAMQACDGPYFPRCTCSEFPSLIIKN